MDCNQRANLTSIHDGGCDRPGSGLSRDLDSSRQGEDALVERVTLDQTCDEEVWLHTSRYRFAADFVKGKHVLDIACGQGYGSSALLRAGAMNVVGVDISDEAVSIARTRYGVNAQVGSCMNIPVASESVDVLVSFETIEHFAEHERFLDEAVRVLRPGGLIVISTPNHAVWKARGHNNPFHVKELYEHEFTGLLADRFVSLRRFTQGCVSAAPWSLRCAFPRNSRWRGVARKIVHYGKPLHRIPGFWRIRERLQAYAGGEYEMSVPSQFRDDPREMILTPKPVDGNMSPFKVRPRSRLSREVYEYMVIVAAKPVRPVHVG